MATGIERRGKRHFMAQFGPCLQWPWSRLGEIAHAHAGLDLPEGAGHAIVDAI